MVEGNCLVSFTYFRQIFNISFTLDRTYMSARGPGDPGRKCTLDNSHRSKVRIFIRADCGRWILHCGRIMFTQHRRYMIPPQQKSHPPLSARLLFPDINSFFFYLQETLYCDHNKTLDLVEDHWQRGQRTGRCDLRKWWRTHAVASRAFFILRCEVRLDHSLD